MTKTALVEHLTNLLDITLDNGLQGPSYDARNDIMLDFEDVIDKIKEYHGWLDTPNAKKFVVTVVDTGDSCDGKARTLKVCNTKEEAKAYVIEDMDHWISNHKDEGIEYDYAKMSAYFDYDTNSGCEWNIEEVEMPL